MPRETNVVIQSDVTPQGGTPVTFSPPSDSDRITVFGSTEVQVRGTYVDASRTPLYLEERGPRLDPRYVLHFVSLCDSRNNDGNGVWYTTELAKVFLGDEEIKPKADGTFNDDISAALEHHILTKAGEAWVFDECPPSPIVFDWQKHEVGYRWSSVPIPTGEARLHFSINHHTVTVDGRELIKYPEVIDVSVNNVSVNGFGVMYSPLALEIHECLSLRSDDLKKALAEDVPRLVAEISLETVVTPDRNLPRVMSKPIAETYSPNMKDSTVEVRCVHRDYRITPSLLFDDYVNDPEVEAHFLVLHDCGRPGYDDGYTESVIAKVFYKGQDITPLAKSKIVGIDDYIEDEHLDGYGDKDYLFHHGLTSTAVAYEHKVSESVWEQPLLVEGVERTLRARVLHHQVDAHNGTKLNYLELLKLEVDGREVLGIEQPELFENIWGGLMTWDNSLFKTAKHVSQWASYKTSQKALQRKESITIELEQSRQAA